MLACFIQYLYCAYVCVLKYWNMCLLVVQISGLHCVLIDELYGLNLYRNRLFEKICTDDATDSYLCGFTAALNNEKKKLVKFHFKHMLMSVYQTGFTF